jgi:hypothetical protein
LKSEGLLRIGGRSAGLNNGASDDYENVTDELPTVELPTILPQRITTIQKRYNSGESLLKAKGCE